MYTYNRFTSLYSRKLTQHCKSTILPPPKKRISVGLIRAELQVKMNFRFDCILFYCHRQEKRAAGSSEDTRKESQNILPHGETEKKVSLLSLSLNTGTVSPLHTNLQVVNLQRCGCVLTCPITLS